MGQQYNFRPYHETIVEALDVLEISSDVALVAIGTLARLCCKTAVPREHRMAVGAAFARKVKAIQEDSMFSFSTLIIERCHEAITSLAQQDEQEDQGQGAGGGVDVSLGHPQAARGL